MNTLAINSYAGSLLLGASALSGAQIIGSFEDSGFGTWCTRANRHRFTEATPDFQFIDHVKHWPDLDLTETNVIAHPPCSAFSNQNRSAVKRGVNAEAFECTRQVLRYAMTNNAASISVESVMGALAGAWDVYDHLAEVGGYHVFRVLQNALLFGVPQYRERCWHVLIRRNLLEGPMTWQLSPKLVSVGATVDHLLPGTPLDKPERLEKYVQLLGAGPCVCGAVHDFDLDAVRRTALSHLMDHRRLGFGARLAPFFPDEDPKGICRRHVSRFASGQPSILAAGGWAPVLLGTSFWIYRGQPLPAEAYKAIMGFPVDYEFPKSKYGTRTMLSKGVCPPVATWILDNVRINLGEAPASAFTKSNGYIKTVESGRIVSFRPGRETILNRLGEMARSGVVEDDELIDLRDEETALEE